ncbi:MAG: GNAT family N-acetyltransferase [Ferroplasma sp.]|uniref:GNAT family N-acetyltransferase n=1 Tax=Ferroplasma sp. TaxID=2591003 RepID=UPI00281601D4|nr:GNAT family N-acetyltransferase [Ferroplasma sp.]WMT52033.1 MAG: GNAT family N-acetyltransferase [Ferroplasma sp.]
MINMHVRFYSDRDFSSISIVEKKAFGEGAYSNYMLKMMLKSPHSFTMVIEDGSSIYGYATIEPLDSRSVDIESIGIIPEQHGRGLGSLLIEAMEAEAARRGYREVFLEVREKNTGAINFYKKHGYSIFEFLPGYYTISYEGSTNAYRMKKII